MLSTLSLHSSSVVVSQARVNILHILLLLHCVFTVLLATLILFALAF